MWRLGCHDGTLVPPAGAKATTLWQGSVASVASASMGQQLCIRCGSAPCARCSAGVGAGPASHTQGLQMLTAQGAPCGSALEQAHLPEAYRPCQTLLTTPVCDGWRCGPRRRACSPPMGPPTMPDIVC